MGGEGLTSCPAYYVEPVTNTSSSSCANDGRRNVLGARHHSSRLCFSQFTTRTVDNTVDLYAAKPDIRPESRFLSTPLAFDAPVTGGSRRNIATPFGTEKLEWCGNPMVKKFRTYLYPIRFDTIHERDGHTDRHTPHDGIGRAYA